MPVIANFIYQTVLIFVQLYDLMKPEKLHTNLSTKEEVKAFKEFFESFYPSVCIFAQKYVRDAGLAEDIAQEAFVEYWKKKENFTDLKAEKGFIYTVTRNKCLNDLKHRDIQKSIFNDKILSDDYFYELIIEEETYSIVSHYVNNLAPQSRKIVWLSMEGIKNQEIADNLNISVNTVKTLKKNAYKELRNQLKDHVFIFFLISYFLN